MVPAGDGRSAGTPRYHTNEEPDLDFDFGPVDDGPVDEARASWRAEVAFAHAFVADAPDLDITGEESHRGAMSLRWVLVHMIEEYACQNGRADLLRECIDGSVVR